MGTKQHVECSTTECPTTDCHKLGEWEGRARAGQRGGDGRGPPCKNGAPRTARVNDRRG